MGVQEVRFVDSNTSTAADLLVVIGEELKSVALK